MLPEFPGVATRLKHLRIAADLKPRYLAEDIGITSGTYYDLEALDSEWRESVSIEGLHILCAQLKTKLPKLLWPKGEPRTALPYEQLCGLIRKKLAAEQLPLEEFEDRVGYLLGPALENPAAVGKWNLECLFSVCAALGVEGSSYL